MSRPTSRCSTIDSSSSCTTSIGSSIVTMCARRARLMWPIIEAIVVVFPVPVGPVIKHEPARAVGELAHHRGQPELLEARDLRAHAPDGEPDEAALAVDVDPEPPDARQRVADVGLVRVQELLALVLAHDGVGERSGVGGRELGGRARRQIAVDAEERHVADLAGAGRSPPPPRRAAAARRCSSLMASARAPDPERRLASARHGARRGPARTCATRRAAQTKPGAGVGADAPGAGARAPSEPKRGTPRLAEGRPTARPAREEAAVRRPEAEAQAGQAAARAATPRRPKIPTTKEVSAGGVRLPPRGRRDRGGPRVAPDAARRARVGSGQGRHRGRASPRRRRRSGRSARRPGSPPRSRPTSATRSTCTSGRTCGSARPSTSS